MPLHITGLPQVRERGEKEAEVRGNHANRQPRPANNRDNGSLNHLLGFTLPPRQHPAPRTSRRSTGRHAHWGHTRERYTNAQYRFMLKPTGDYAVHFADPDIYFNWPDVLQVVVPTSTVLPAAAPTFEGPSTSSDSLLPSCPICLSEPVAPRMTKCGHIFCFPCLLHYLELAEGPGQKVRSCPICFDTVYARELKSVKWFDPVSAASESEASQSHSLVPAGEAEQEEGDFITMRLMHRTTISTLALPRSPTWPSELIPPHAAPWHFAPDILGFSRFMLATPDYMTAELRKDLQQLDEEVRNLKKLGTAPDDLGLVFIEAAKRKVLEQIEKVGVLRTDHIQRSSESAWLELEALKDKEGAAARRREWEQERAMTSTTSASETDEYVPPDAVLHGGAQSPYRPSPNKPQVQRTAAAHPSSPNPRNNRTRKNINPPPPNDATYLFYQASSGQHIYLHPLDIKILLAHFGSYSAFPLAIRVKVEGTEEGSMNDDLRKRCRYLAHLPEACDLTFVEADLSRVISPEALAPYAQALKKRVTKRKEKSKKDDRARVKAEQATQEKEREALGNRSYRRRDPGEPLYASLPQDMAGFTLSEDDPPLSTSPSAVTTLSASPAADGRSTVWGTRAIAAPAGQQREEDSYAESAADSAWNDFDMMHERGGRRQGRKKKVVLNLSGGAVQMRR